MFAGNQDFICNHVGIESVIASTEWNDDGPGVSLPKEIGRRQRADWMCGLVDCAYTIMSGGR